MKRAILLAICLVAAAADARAACTYTLTPTSASVPAAAGSGTFSVAASSAGCKWRATVKTGTFLSVSPKSGSGNATLTFTYTDNTSTSSRQGTISVQGAIFTVTQQGASAPPPPPPSLDPAYATADIGSVGLTGSATSSNGVFTVSGAGADIWGTADSFRFVYQQLTGDGEVVARLVSMQNTNAYAKAGVMLRADLTAGAAHVILDMKPSGGEEFMARSAAGGSTSYLAGATQPAPVYLKLSRAGSTITSYVSPDATTWSQVGSTTATLPGTVYAGLIVCSHDTTQLNTSTFDTVTITATPSSQNLPPTANAGAPQTVTGGSTVQLNGSGTDPEGHPLTYAWSQTAGTTVALSDPTIANPTFVAPAATDVSQSLTFQLVVNDGVQNSAPSSVTVTVQAASSVSTGSLLPPRPTGGATINVPAGGDLQHAINNARPGDVIVLDAGATYTGNFSLPSKGGTAYVMITSSQTFADGTRVTPATTGLATLKSPSSAPVVITAAGASYYWLEGLELATAGGPDDIVRLGDGSSAQNALSLVPHDLVVNHCYVHGKAGVEQKRGIALNSGLTYIADSYIEEIKGAGYDTQAICGWNGPGPYRIYDNYLSAAGENVLFGGADPSIANLVPTDITFKGNYLTKPTSWRGSSWTVKNIFELKNAQQVVIDGNTFEYNWLAAQAGYSILFTPRNQGGTAPWTVVKDVQFSNNRVRHVAAVFNLLGYDNLNPSQQTQNITIANNVYEDVSAANWGGTGRLLLIDGGANVKLDHNTVFEDGSSLVYGYGSPTTGFVFTSNIANHNAYGIFGDNTSPGMGALNQYFPGSIVTGNLLVGATIAYPSGNYYPATMANVGFVDLAGGDYRLASTSLYKGVGADGTDPGADMTKIK